MERETAARCATCQKDQRPIGEETSERYEYIPAQLKVVEDVCKKYACECTVKTATKPPRPIEKSTAGASLLAQVIVAKTADYLPLKHEISASPLVATGKNISVRRGGGEAIRRARTAPPPSLLAIRTRITGTLSPDGYGCGSMLSK